MNQGTDIQKLNAAKDLLESVYLKYGDVLRDNYSICTNLACADKYILETIEELKALKESI